MPSGTLVRVEDFLKFVPVRRQASLKNPSKLLAHMKTFLQSYAFTRPHVSFSLSVLKEENHVANWIYAPKQDANIMDAAIRIFKFPLASNCMLKYWTPSKGLIESQSIQEDEAAYTITALLPALECGRSDSGGSHFFSYLSRARNCESSWCFSLDRLSAYLLEQGKWAQNV